MPDNGAATASDIDMSNLSWRRPAGASQDEVPGVMEVAIAPRPDCGSWVLLRVAGDPAGRVLVYDEHEWACFLDGVRKGEFDLRQ